MRRVAMAEDRETAEKLREFFRSQGIDAEIRESGAEFEILVPDSKAEEALLMAKSLFESTREKRNQWDGDSDDAAEGGRLWERLRGAASVLLRDIIFSFRPVTWTILAFIIISYILELTVPGYLRSMGYPDIRRGEGLEIWRLVSPAFCHLGIFHHLPGYVRRTVGQAQLQAQHVHQPLGCGLGPGIGHARLGQCRAAEYGQQRQQNTDSSLHINASNVFSRSAQR